MVVTVVPLLIIKEQRVSDEDEDGSQDERDKHLDVDVVSGTMQFPEDTYTCLGFRGSIVWWEVKKKKNWISPEQKEDGDGDSESNERDRVSDCVHGLHVGEIHVRVWGLNRE